MLRQCTVPTELALIQKEGPFMSRSRVGKRERKQSAEAAKQLKAQQLKKSLEKLRVKR
jgi:hypothetical protein